MKLFTATTLLLLAASCSATAPSEAALDPATLRSTVMGLEHQEGRVLANRMRMFLNGSDVKVHWTGSVWKVIGTEDEVAFACFLVDTFDSPAVTFGHCAVLEDFESGDAHDALAAARSAEGWNDDWIVAARTDDRWYGMVPTDELETYVAVVKSVQHGG